jgi:hypothetical protein
MIKECVVCGTPFEALGSSKMCGEECRRARRSEQGARFRANHPEKLREYKDKFRANHPEKLREYNARFRAKNREKLREYDARYRAENLEECRAATRISYRRKTARNLLMKNLHPIASNAGA